jgi:hypothetical protein
MLSVNIPPSSCVVQAKAIDYGDDMRISRLRAVRMGLAVDCLKPIGHISVLFAQCGVFDANLLEETINSFGEDFLVKATDNTKQFGIVNAPTENTVIMAYVRTGFGSGSYSVFALFDGDFPIGIEACFIDPPEGKDVFLRSNR